MSKKQSHISRTLLMGNTESPKQHQHPVSKWARGKRTFDICMGLNIDLISAWLANVLVLSRQVIIPLELYWKGLTFIFNRGIWDVPMPCNYIPTALVYFSKIKFHSWLCACVIGRASTDKLSLWNEASFRSESLSNFKINIYWGQLLAQKPVMTFLSICNLRHRLNSKLHFINRNKDEPNTFFFFSKICIMHIAYRCYLYTFIVWYSLWCERDLELK